MDESERDRGSERQDVAEALMHLRTYRTVKQRACIDLGASAEETGERQSLPFSLCVLLYVL